MFPENRIGHISEEWTLKCLFFRVQWDYWLFLLSLYAVLTFVDIYSKHLSDLENKISTVCWFLPQDLYVLFPPMGNTVESWTTQGLGVLTPHTVENPGITFDPS